MKNKKSIFHKKSDAGKGDVPRVGISASEWSDRWDKIFEDEYEKSKKEDQNTDRPGDESAIRELDTRLGSLEHVQKKD